MTEAACQKGGTCPNEAKDLVLGAGCPGVGRGRIFCRFTRSGGKGDRNRGRSFQVGKSAAVRAPGQRSRGRGRRSGGKSGREVTRLRSGNRLHVREGAAVKVGDLLAEIEPDVNQAQSLSEVYGGLTQAELKLKDAQQGYVVQKALFDRDLVAREALRDYQVKLDIATEEYKAAQRKYRIVQDRGIPISANSATQKARIKSPMAGVIIKKDVELGESVMSGVSSFNAGTVLYTVADLSSLIIRVKLNEVDIAKVTVGQPVQVTLDAYPQRTFAGKVTFVAPAAELLEKIKVFKVEIELDRLGPEFRTGMSANVEILGEKRDGALSIPLEALQRRDGQTVAFPLKKGLKADQIRDAKDGLSGRSKFIWLADHWKEYFSAVPVKAGIATLERVEILSGLTEGDEVALEDPSRKKVEKDDENN